MQMNQVYVAYDGQDNPPPDGFDYCPHCRTALALKDVGRKRRSVCPNCGFIRFRNPAPAVSLLIIKDEQVLLGKRRCDPGRGQWATPSGYIEYEDDFLTTAIREAKEETGLDVDLKSVIHVASSFTSPGYHFLTIYLLAGVVGGKLIPGDDLEAVDWFPVAGPWPDLAFQEDVDLLEAYSSRELPGLPIGPGSRT
jgi:8-oxo-dGTP diphosphatase